MAQLFVRRIRNFLSVAINFHFLVIKHSYLFAEENIFLVLFKLHIKYFKNNFVRIKNFRVQEYRTFVQGSSGIRMEENKALLPVLYSKVFGSHY